MLHIPVFGEMIDLEFEKIEKYSSNVQRLRTLRTLLIVEVVLVGIRLRKSIRRGAQHYTIRYFSLLPLVQLLCQRMLNSLVSLNHL